MGVCSTSYIRASFPIDTKMNDMSYLMEHVRKKDGRCLIDLSIVHISLNRG